VHLGSDPGQFFTQRVGAEQCQCETMFTRTLGVSLQFRHVGLGAREFDMSGRLELDILAEKVIEVTPQRLCPAGQRQFGEMPPLLAHASEIDATGTRAA
jgi:hypothetical protein